MICKKSSSLYRLHSLNDVLGHDLGLYLCHDRNDALGHEMRTPPHSLISSYLVHCLGGFVPLHEIPEETKREVVNFTRYHVKNYSELINFKKLTRIEGYNGK